VRPPQLVPQFQHPHQATATTLTGIIFTFPGSFLKVVVADTLMAGSSNAVFVQQNHYPP
jgi:hypothetical protein